MSTTDIKKLISKLPDTPGVYFFKSGKNILYIGKATSLRDRVRSYMSRSVLDSRGPLIEKMLREFDSIAYKKTDSVLEALILEASLIKKHQPPANIKDKDNRSFNYVVITDEDFPRVLLMRERELEQIGKENNSPPLATLGPSLKLREGKGRVRISKTFGPFTNGSQLKEAMKIVRRMFPYRDNKCVPAEEQTPHPPYRHPPLEQGRENHKPQLSRVPSPEQGEGRVGFKACFNRHIGLCPGVCTGEISKEDYAKQIKNIALFFEGNKSKLIKSLQKEMKEYAKNREFERAQGIKNKIYALYHIQDVSLIKSDKLKNISVQGEFSDNFKIESYDIAHLSGTNVVGVMTAVEDGEVKKSDYRKFKIKTATVDDTKALTEILNRRLNHPEWPMPNLIVVDGGMAQKNAMEKVLAEHNLKIPVVSVVKDEHHKPREILGTTSLKLSGIKMNYSQLEPLVLLANAEAHRFAISFHRYRRGKFL